MTARAGADQRTASPVGYDPARDLVQGRVRLRHPQGEDFAEWARVREASRAFLTPWEPSWSTKDLTRTAYRQRLRAYARGVQTDKAYPFFLFPRDHGALLGGLSLNHVRRGATQSCELGYWIGAPHAGQGYMSEAVGLALKFAFHSLRLHRVEASCVPANTTSRRVLEKTGFREEGYARSYRQINGVWEDHLLFAILASDISAS